MRTFLPGVISRLDRRGARLGLGPWLTRAGVGAAAAAGLVVAALVLSGSGGATTTAVAKTVKPLGRPVTIAWAGDTTLGSSYGAAPQQGWGLLAPVARLLRAADLSAVNNEGTYATGGASKCAGGDSATCFSFRAPPANARALKRAGVDIVNLANNHAFDFGAVGLGQTVRALKAAGVAATGRPYEIRTLEIAGARVAFAGFSTYQWSSPMSDPAAIRTIIGDAARKANIVVAFLHAGAEGSDKAHTPVGDEEAFGEARGNVRAFARAAIDAGADLVAGSGPHVLRGIELYRGRLIAYSLGNLAGYKNFSTAGDSALSGILRVTLADDGRFLVGRLESLRLDGSGIPHVDKTRAAAKLVSRLSREDFGASGVIVSAEGALEVPGK